MAVLSGDVNIGIKLTGSGDGVARTKQAERAIADLERKIGETSQGAKKAAAATSGFSASLDSIKTGVKPLDGVRSVFENLRANFLGFPQAVAGVVSGLAAVIVKFAEGGSAAERLRVKADEYREALAGARKDLEALQKLQGIEPPNPDAPFGANAGERFGEITDKLLTLQKRLRELQAIDAIGKQVDGVAVMSSFLADVDDRYLAIKRTENEILEIEKLRATLVNETADATERQARGIQAMVDAARNLTTAGMLSRTTGVAANDLFATWAGGSTKPTATPRRGGGGGGGNGADDWWREKVRSLTAGNDNDFGDADFMALERTLQGAAGRGPGFGSTERQGKKGDRAKFLAEKAARKELGDGIRDFSAALSEALPGMSEFQASLASIAEIWTAWGEGSKGTADAVVGSLGAIATAGAQQIKDERARAGVLAIIQLGLGLGKVFIPGLQAEAAGHFAAAATLGTVAIFGSGGRASGGGGGRGAAPTRGAPARVGGEQLGTGNVSLTIHGNYYGGRREQEAASDFARLTRRRGNGFADEGRRSAA